MSKQELKQKGFTIIEVVLVLAIAALIFLMVFIALPALQSSQRDTARKSDVSIVAAAYNSWMGNNRSGTATAPTAAQLQTYVTNLSDNSTQTGIVVVARGTTVSVTPVDGIIRVVTGAKCGVVTAGSVALSAGTLRQYATMTKLEAGGGSAYCLDS